MIRRALVLATAAVLGFVTAAFSAPPHHPAKHRPPPKHRPPAKRCKRHRHHHHCRPKPKPGKPTKPPKPGGTTTTGTTTTGTSGGGTTTGTTTTPPAGPLPSRLEVDENDQGQDPQQPYSLWPSHNPVASGTVKFNVYNFGEDPHTFAIFDSEGHQLTIAQVPANQPQTAVPVSANLAPGTYTLECTLPGHVGLGMVATLTVR